jgi:glycosyltransferase involved in cell wall biosynthesis
MSAPEQSDRRRPEVSVVIPTRNRLSHLNRALRSVLTQEDVDLEAIVVDDGSTDETAAMLDAMSDPRVRAIRRRPPHGPALARNAGVDAARGEWLAFLDDDDLWAPRKLRAQLDAARRARAGFAYSGVVHLDKSREHVVFVGRAPAPVDLERRLLVHNIIPGGCSNAIVRREVVEKVGSFDEQLAELADWDLWLRVVGETAAAATPELHVAYLEHEQNMLFRDKPRVSREVDYLERKHADARRAHDVKLDRRFLRHWVGYQYRRAARTHRDEGRPLLAARYFLRSALLSENPLDLVRAGATLVGERALQPARGARRVLARALRRNEAYAVPPDLSPAGPAWLEAYR